MCRSTSKRCRTFSGITNFVNERLARNGNGTFTRWVTERCGFTDRTARNYIAAFETFGQDAETVSGTFDAKAMYLLSSDNTPETATKQALELAKGGHESLRSELGS